MCGWLRFVWQEVASTKVAPVAIIWLSLSLMCCGAKAGFHVFSSLEVFYKTKTKSICIRYLDMLKSEICIRCILFCILYFVSYFVFCFVFCIIRRCRTCWFVWQEAASKLEPPSKLHPLQSSADWPSGKWMIGHWWWWGWWRRWWWPWRLWLP